MRGRRRGEVGAEEGKDVEGQRGGETKDVHASQNYEVKLEIFALYHLVSKPDWHNIAHIATRHNRYV